MIHFIVNPVSSSGNGSKVWEQTRARLQERQIPYRAHMLKQPGDAGRIAATLSQGEKKRLLVVMGGDGTVNEVVSGLSRFDGITLGYIPTGSGNDFARGMQLPKDPERALAMILHPRKTRAVDIGITRSGDVKRCFAVSSGIGYDAAVCYDADRSPLKKVLNTLHLGKLIYLIGALKDLLQIRPFPADVVLDDAAPLHFDRVYFAAAMNTRYEGGGFDFAPKADPGDGRLDLILAEGLPKWKVVLILPTALFGKHTGFRGIHLHRAAAITIASSGAPGQCIHTDGEHFGFAQDVTFSLSAQKLRLIVG